MLADAGLVAEKDFKKVLYIEAGVDYNDVSIVLATAPVRRGCCAPRKALCSDCTCHARGTGPAATATPSARNGRGRGAAPTDSTPVT